MFRRFIFPSFRSSFSRSFSLSTSSSGVRYSSAPLGRISLSSSASAAASSSPPRRSRLLRSLFFFGCSLSSLALFQSVGQHYFPSDSLVARSAERISIYRTAAIRLARDVWTLCVIICDYEWNLRGLDGGLERDLRKHEIHLRCANRLRSLLFSNGGIYIKFAQHIAQAKHILPEEYVEVCMDSMQRAPVSEDYEEVRSTIKEEFGAFPEEIFLEFDPKPLASASLAQVHYATLPNPSPKSGESAVVAVAVKVQHRFLKHSVDADLFIIESLVDCVNWLFPHLDYRWLAQTVRKNLPTECDFLLEARNCERTAMLFRDNPDVAVPRVISGLTSKRVLTMEFMDGVECTNLEQLKQWQISPHHVSHLISHVFCDMIFKSGFLHADPHPGNVFVRPHPKNPTKPQLILLDHGLYVQLDDSIRYKYSNLWRSLIFSDAGGIERWAKSLNTGDNWMVFSGMISRKGWDEIMGETMEEDHPVKRTHAFNHLAQDFSESEKARLQKYTVQYSKEIQQTLAMLPPELILILKTNDCLRFIDQELQTNFNGFIVMSRYCIQNINQFNLEHAGNNPFLSSAQQQSGGSIRLRNWWNLLTLELGIFAFQHYILFDSLIRQVQNAIQWPFKRIARIVQSQQRKEDPPVIILSVK